MPVHIADHLAHVADVIVVVLAVTLLQQLNYAPARLVPHALPTIFGPAHPVALIRLQKFLPSVLCQAGIRDQSASRELLASLSSCHSRHSFHYPPRRDPSHPPEQEGSRNSYQGPGSA
jgi:hypothetical protein